MRKVEVTPYNKQWVWMYEEEANKLRLIFGEQLAAIHHIGSTSVPGLEAKPMSYINGKNHVRSSGVSGRFP
ncbi:GrpB family protein [Paenibacillus sp. alder61]|uniref:GrpB family protein n=1 Tax=Paenibacillus faecis TaxID=862114 RepID=A0A5D0CX84_9BACL|nr:MULTISPECIES: GrpB family protein [Paenibacillus]MCA1291462.1 GrpB family protein [Paenibacillus sp. alder61]TYA14629.1 GrpB family protein [Paenibacillus faecis]